MDSPLATTLEQEMPYFCQGGRGHWTVNYSGNLTFYYYFISLCLVGSKLFWHSPFRGNASEEAIRRIFTDIILG